MPDPRAPIAEVGLALVGVLELEGLQERLLAAFATATDALGSAVWVRDERGDLVLRAWRGLVDREALPGRVDRARAEAVGGEGSLRVPLVVDGELVGLVLLEGGARGPLGADQRAAAAELAPFAAVAVKNARRFQAVERAGFRDRETGAYHLAYFVDYAGKEIYKARRYGRSLSLAVLTLDNLDDLRREPRDALRAATRAVISAVSRVVRDADVLARVSEREHYVLLPETDHFGALMLVRRAREEIRREPAVRALDERCRVALSLGAATFPADGDEFDELLATCRARQEEQRASLVGRLGLDAEGGPGFWELADALLASGGVAIPAGSVSARLPLDPELLAAVEREAAREIGRDPRARGVLYVSRSSGAALPAAVAALPRLEAAARAGDVGAHVFVLGPRAGAAPHAEGHPLVTHVPVEGDPRLDAHAFVLFLSERAAYGLLQGPGGRVFHTADAPLVDALVARLQALYDLQPL